MPSSGYMLIKYRYLVGPARYDYIYNNAEFAFGRRHYHTYSVAVSNISIDKYKTRHVTRHKHDCILI